MKRFVLLILAVFVGGLLYTVYAQAQDSGATDQTGPTLPERMHKGKEMIGTRGDMQRRTEMMRKAGVSEDQIRQWKAFSNAPMYMDSPEALLGQADTLGLSSDQKQKLQDIQKNARDQAKNVLTADQKSKLGTVSDQPTTMMEVHKSIMAKMGGAMRKRTMREGGMGSGMSCPMCPMGKDQGQTDSGTQTTQPSGSQ